MRSCVSLYGGCGRMSTAVVAPLFVIYTRGPMGALVPSTMLALAHILPLVEPIFAGQCMRLASAEFKNCEAVWPSFLLGLAYIQSLIFLRSNTYTAGSPVCCLPTFQSEGYSMLQGAAGSWRRTHTPEDVLSSVSFSTPMADVRKKAVYDKFDHSHMSIRPAMTPIRLQPSSLRWAGGRLLNKVIELATDRCEFFYGIMGIRDFLWHFQTLVQERGA